MLSGQDRVSGTFDQGDLGGIQQSMAAVDDRAALLDPCQGINQIQGNPLIADREVVDRSLGLCPPECLGGHIDRTDAVVFLSLWFTHRRMPLPTANRMHGLRLPG